MMTGSTPILENLHIILAMILAYISHDRLIQKEMARAQESTETDWQQILRLEKPNKVMSNKVMS